MFVLCSYFPVESTQEMLDEWKPLLCPFDASMIEAAEYFSDFLPTLVPIENQDLSYKLWLHELARLWLIPGNHSSLEEVRIHVCMYMYACMQQCHSFLCVFRIGSDYLLD